MRAALIFQLVWAAFGICSWAFPEQQPQSVLVELRLRAPVGAYVPIVIRQAGRQAQLHLYSQPGHPEIYQGFYSLRLTDDMTHAAEIEFGDPQGKILYASVSQSKFQTRYRLFGNKDARDRNQAEIDAAANATATATTDSAPVVEPTNKTASSAAKNEAQLRQALQQKEEALRLEARQQEDSRLKTEIEESKKREKLQLEQEKMSATVREKKQQQAKEKADAGMESYRHSEYFQAVDFFSQATELDPQNDSYYFQYAVSLYKINEYNKSLAMFSQAEGPSVNALEKDYYVALNHMRLQEFDKALKGFAEVREENDPQLSPVAAYFAGTLQFQAEKFPEARENLEYVLDTSRDPKMDSEAEQLLEEINRIESYLASSKEKYRLNLSLGAIYDSNVLNIAAQNLATDVAAIRATYGASVLGHLYRTHRQDLAAQIGVSDYYSWSTKMQNDSILQSTDPLELSFLLPYSRQFEWRSYGHNLNVIPSYKTTSLALSGGARSTVVTTTALAASLATGLRPDWISEINLEVGHDVSGLHVTSVDDDQSTSRWTIGTTQTKILHPSGNQSVAVDLQYTSNAATGINYRYQKTGLGLTYTHPGFWQVPLSYRFDYSNQIYPQATTDRTDRLLSLTVAQVKNLSPQWTLTSSLVGTNSQSNQDTYKYNKFMISTALSYHLSVLGK